MKNSIPKLSKNLLFKVFIMLGLFFFTPQQTEAQFLKKLAKKAKEKVEQEADKRSEKRVNKKIDEGFDTIENEIDGKNKEDKNDNKTTSEKESRETSDEPKSPNVVWNKFDFVPGDQVIFEDSPSTSEENGEFPSRWDLHNGNIEIVEFDGEKVIMSLESGEIVPYLKNSKEDYLPEVFTIEFDVYFAKGSNDHRYYLDLWDKKTKEMNLNMVRKLRFLQMV